MSFGKLSSRFANGSHKIGVPDQHNRELRLSNNPDPLQGVKPGAVVGNSSSDLLEAPTLGSPTVNIGTRQGGRLRASSVVDCEPTASAIEVAVNNVLQPQYRLTLAGLYNRYGLGGMCIRIVEVLETMALDGLTMKVFHDFPPASGCG